MMFFSRIGARVVLIAALFAIFVSVRAYAADKEKQPDPMTNPVLASIIKMGSKLYYLGNRTGMEGWLIVKDGQVQLAYALPNSKYAVIGGMFGPDGENTSADEVQALLTVNKELNASLISGIRESLGINPAAAAAGQPMDAAQAAVPPTIPPAVAAAMQQPAASAPTNAMMPLLPPGERLMRDLQNAAGINIGESTAPLLLMVMDPNCPHCQATWRALRENVMGKKLQIRLVPIGTQDTDHERAAAVLLHVADPLNVWDKYVGGDKTQLAGTPEAALVAAIRSNYALIDSWHIQMTPYLVYRAKDGKVKIVQGEPEQASAVLSDIQP